MTWLECLGMTYKSQLSTQLPFHLLRGTFPTEGFDRMGNWLLTVSLCLGNAEHNDDGEERRKRQKRE